MAKRGLKIFGIGVGTLLVVAGIIVGILFATGVIKVPSKDESSPTSTDDKKDIIHPTKYCGKAPTITSFEKLNGQFMFPKYRISWSDPIQNQCAHSMEWFLCQTMISENGTTSETCKTFRATANQTYYDLELDNYKQTIHGDVWLKIIANDSSGWGIESNKYPYSILPTK